MANDRQMPSDTEPFPARATNGVLVAQLGARRHYAVPIALHKKGRLARFCTDFYLNAATSRFAASFGRVLHLPAIQRLRGRRADELPSRMVQSFPLFGIQYKMREQRATTDRELVSAWLWGGRRFCELVAKTLDSQCDTVFAFSSGAKELFENAQTLGIRSVLDHATAPLLFEHCLVQEEKERFPRWSERETEVPVQAYHERQFAEMELADLVLCGSDFVRDAILAEGAPAGKIRVVPLGVQDYFFSLSRGVKASNDPLRVLFLGDDGLRKGIGYLAAAAEALKGKIEVRAVGSLQLSAEGRGAVGKSIELVGPVARRSIGGVFRWADVLVLPSVSDTFGLVILEAMAAGLPVIATPHTCAPRVLRDQVDGFIVPVRDAVSLKDRLEMLADDRELLHHLAENARQRACEFTLSKYADRLTEALA